MNLEEKLINYIKQKKNKTIGLQEIYPILGLPYSPQNDEVIYHILIKLEKEGYIKPLKTSKKNYQGSFEKYKIISIRKEDEQKIKEEILKLDGKIKIDYYLKHPDEYEKNKRIILPINKFIKENKENSLEELTVNERSYEIYKSEKCLKENEEILKKLGLNYKDLYAYETYEPFFYYINANYNKNASEKQIIIIENKDTFWTIVKTIKQLKIDKIYMVIYGEGKKILKSFLYMEEFKISKNDTIYYFGDIDYEGINIYISLKEKFHNYSIFVYKKGYESILDIEKEPMEISHNQNINKDKIN